MLDNARWIWIDDEGVDTYGEFFAELFTNDTDLKIDLSCDGDYTLFVNGKFVSSNQYGDFEHYKIYDTIDLSSYLCVGKNAIAILVWHFGKPSQRYKLYKPGLIFQVYGKNGVVLSSDKDTISRKSKAYKNGLCKEISAQLGLSYYYDMSREDSWIFGNGEGFGESVIVKKETVFFPRPTKRLELGKALLCKEILNEGNTHFIFDLGCEAVGLLSLSLECDCETELLIAYGELLKDGSVKRRLGARDFSVEYKTTIGCQQYTNYMLRLACRYLEIWTPQPVFFKEIGIIPQFYPIVENSYDFLNGVERDIYKICLNTLKLCMMEHYVDCPWREQNLYAFDSRNQMLCGYYALLGQNKEYARANLILISQDRRDDGLLSICYPCGVDLTIPSFSLYYILSIKEYMSHTGDLSIFERVDSKLREIISTFLNNRENGLACKFSGTNHWAFYDWSYHLEGNIFHEEDRVSDFMINALLALALSSYKEICALASLPFTYEMELCEIRELSDKAFYDEKSGLYFLSEKAREPLALANALAICSGIAPRDRWERISKALTDGSLPMPSLSMTCFIYDALLLTSKEKYKDYILEKIKSDYSQMIESGTVWETALGESDFHGAGSLCHGWSAIPIYYYHKLLRD